MIDKNAGRASRFRAGRAESRTAGPAEDVRVLVVEEEDGVGGICIEGRRAM